MRVDGSARWKETVVLTQTTGRVLSPTGHYIMSHSAQILSVREFHQVGARALAVAEDSWITCNPGTNYH